MQILAMSTPFSWGEIHGVCPQADGKRCPSPKAGAQGPTVLPGACGATGDILTMREVKPFQFDIKGKGGISEHAAQPSWKEAVGYPVSSSRPEGNSHTLSPPSD